MPVRIRLSRGGAKKRPFYRIVVADSRRSRDGKFIDQLGTYNPMLEKDNPERVKLDADKAKDWIAKGAQPSDRVKIFLSNINLIDKPIITEKTKKHLPKKKEEKPKEAGAGNLRKKNLLTAEKPAEEKRGSRQLRKTKPAEEKPKEEALRQPRKRNLLQKNLRKRRRQPRKRNLLKKNLRKRRRQPRKRNLLKKNLRKRRRQPRKRNLLKKNLRKKQKKKRRNRKKSS